jgi:phosphohistidine phosphatase
MDLLLVRHADAGDARSFAGAAQSDDLRPLSPKGEEQMREAAIAIRELLPSCDTVAASPLVRAVQTAQLLAAAYGLPEPQTTRALVPGIPLPEFEAWARQFGDTQCVAVVGHEPHLSTLATWLMTKSEASRVELKKGAACLLEFPGPLRAGSATLRWLLSPRQLELIAGACSPARG